MDNIVGSDYLRKVLTLDAISLLGYGFKIYRKPVFDFININYDILKDIVEILYYQLNKYKDILIDETTIC